VLLGRLTRIRGRGAHKLILGTLVGGSAVHGSGSEICCCRGLVEFLGIGSMTWLPPTLGVDALSLNEGRRLARGRSRPGLVVLVVMEFAHWLMQSRTC
jgi:hypothetical protein